MICFVISGSERKIAVISDFSVWADKVLYKWLARVAQFVTLKWIEGDGGGGGGGGEHVLCWTGEYQVKMLSGIPAGAGWF